MARKNDELHISESLFGHRKRGSTELFVDILDSIGGGCKKTHLMYKANLSHSQMGKYVVTMLERELIGFNENEYHLTWKGWKALNMFKEWRRLVS